MRGARFNRYLFGLLSSCGDPRIARVERYDADGQVNVRVVGTDGVAIELMAVRAAPPQGGDWRQYEEIIVKPGHEPRSDTDEADDWKHPSLLEAQVDARRKAAEEAAEAAKALGGR